ncbi:MAG: DUF885 domain-containing protein [candidate division WOR-3 bacterium]|nr:MAG: DUF885 domain-containing protein [candidate division WOR-3 bacterium]
MSQFTNFVEKYLEFSWKTSPISATYAGIHKYDHELDNVESDFIQDITKKRKEYLDELEGMPSQELSGEDRIDWQLLRNDIESSIKDYEEIRFWKKQAAYYPELCAHAMFILSVREFAPLGERSSAILSRMRQVPHVLKEGIKNLDDCPRLFVTLGMEMTNACISFIEDLTPGLINSIPGLKKKIEDASREAISALQQYRQHLETELLQKSRGDFAIGSTLFDFKLKNDHMLSYDAQDILEIGQETKKKTEEALRQAAHAIDSNKDWFDVVGDIKREHPQASELLQTYKREMESARRFVIDKDLVTVPPDEHLNVIPTPSFSQPIIPYAAYMNPAQFEEQQTGHFYVTLVDERLSQEQKEEILRGHPKFGIPVIALHEGYPGHHLQLVIANKLKNRLRRLLETTVFIEGWALYCEEMMYEAGFYADPRSRLLQLKDQLWRACRVIIDVGLHTKTMTYDQAVDLLVKDAKLERVHAQKEVTRYTLTPTQPMSYLIGKKQILELKDDYQKKIGSRFNLREFHDKLLSFGSIPVCLIRKELGLY